MSHRDGPSGNAKLMVDMYDVNTRHEVNVQTKVSLDASPGMMAQVGKLRPADITDVMRILRADVGSTERNAMHAAASPAVKALLQMIRVSGARVQGSPANLHAMRQAAVGLRDFFGPWTTFVTLNPSELHSQVRVCLCCARKLAMSFVCSNAD